MPMEEVSAYMQSPVGVIKITGTHDFITQVWFVDEAGQNPAQLPAMVKRCMDELAEYFNCKRQQFTVTLHAEGSDFQKQVWHQLTLIPYGQTVTYGQIAKALGDPEASQAVGAANGKNPIGIIIPCHRVIGQNGKLTGYAGGPWRKAQLLSMEGNISGKNPSLF